MSLIMRIMTGSEPQDLNGGNINLRQAWHHLTHMKMSLWKIDVLSSFSRSKATANLKHALKNVFLFWKTYLNCLVFRKLFGFFISIYFYLFIYLGGVLDSLEPWRFLDPIFSRDSFLRLISVYHFPNLPKAMNSLLLCRRSLQRLHVCFRNTSGLWISVVPSNIPSEREVQKGRHQKQTERWNRLLANDRRPTNATWHCTVWIGL